MSEETSELAERGEDIFKRVVQRQVEDEDPHKYIAIDVDSEDFEVDSNQAAAAKRLLERHPDAEGRIWFRRVGSRITHHFGGRLRRAESE